MRQTINWKGCLQEGTRTGVRQSDEFKNLYEKLMGVARNIFTDEYRESSVSIPALDDPITLGEASAQVGKITADKTCGPDGTAPRVLKLVHLHWLVLIVPLFNMIFTTAHYPLSWTVHNKDDRKDAKNYRGISVIKHHLQII